MVESLLVPCTGCACAGKSSNDEIPLPKLAAELPDVPVDPGVRVVVAVDRDRAFVTAAVICDIELAGEMVGDRTAEAADAAK